MIIFEWAKIEVEFSIHILDQQEPYVGLSTVFGSADDADIEEMLFLWENSVPLDASMTAANQVGLMILAEA